MSLPWIRLLIFGWALLWAATQIYHFLPASYWFEVDDVYVRDAASGSAPTMEVERTIHRPFLGEYTVIVRRENEDGFYHFCAATGDASYEPDSSLPNPMTLDWWTYPKQCDLPAGRYRVHTAWKMFVEGHVVKTLRVRSNIFTIHD